MVCIDLVKDSSSGESSGLHFLWLLAPIAAVMAVIGLIGFVIGEDKKFRKRINQDKGIVIV